MTSTITLTYDTTTLYLSERLQWTDEYEWTPVQQATEYRITGALLIEIGNNRNTLSEALAACPIIAEALERAYRARN